jgi:hypothetical protein
MQVLGFAWCPHAEQVGAALKHGHNVVVANALQQGLTVHIREGFSEAHQSGCLVVRVGAALKHGYGVVVANALQQGSEDAHKGSVW